MIVNARYPERFSDAERTRLQRARAKARSPLATSPLGAALSEHARAAPSASSSSACATASVRELVELPYLFAEQIGRAELECSPTRSSAGLLRSRSWADPLSR